MTISKEQIRKLIEDAKKKGYSIGVRDIAFVVLMDTFEDENITYKCLFGSDKDFVQEYAQSYAMTSAITFIRDYITANFEDRKRTRKKYDDDISFDENKAYMLKLKKDTEKAMEDGDIEKKDALKILADISVKLNDKFNVRDADEGRQTVVVNQKYNDVCPQCRCEISRRPITKEEAMELYDLVEKDYKMMEE